MVVIKREYTTVFLICQWPVTSYVYSKVIFNLSSFKKLAERSNIFGWVFHVLNFSKMVCDAVLARLKHAQSRPKIMANLLFSTKIAGKLRVIFATYFCIFLYFQFCESSIIISKAKLIDPKIWCLQLCCCIFSNALFVKKSFFGKVAASASKTMCKNANLIDWLINQLLEKWSFSDLILSTFLQFGKKSFQQKLFGMAWENDLWKKLQKIRGKKKQTSAILVLAKMRL